MSGVLCGDIARKTMSTTTPSVDPAQSITTWESARQKAAVRGECQFEADFSFV